VIMYPQCTHSKAIEHGTLPPHPLFKNPRTTGKQNFAWYHITEIMPRSKCTVWGWSLPVFVSPMTANFSTSIALCVYLPQEGSYGISHEFCVGEVARRSRGSLHQIRVCFYILVFASGTTRSKDDTKLESLCSKYDLYLKMLCPVTKLLLLVHQLSCPISDRK